MSLTKRFMEENGYLDPGHPNFIGKETQEQIKKRQMLEILQEELEIEYDGDWDGAGYVPCNVIAGQEAAADRILNLFNQQP